MIKSVEYLPLLMMCYFGTAEGVGSVQFEPTAVGRNLSCYVCLDMFKDKTYDVNTKCQNPVKNLDVIQCGSGAQYCKVERVQLHSVMISIERSCADNCFYGCKFNGFGLMYERCTSCCRARGCNTDNGAAGRTGLGPATVWTAILSMLFLSWTDL